LKIFPAHHEALKGRRLAATTFVLTYEYLIRECWLATEANYVNIRTVQGIDIENDPIS